MALADHLHDLGYRINLTSKGGNRLIIIGYTKQCEMVLYRGTVTISGDMAMSMRPRHKKAKDDIIDTYDVTDPHWIDHALSRIGLALGKP